MSEPVSAQDVRPGDRALELSPERRESASEDPLEMDSIDRAVPSFEPSDGRIGDLLPPLLKQTPEGIERFAAGERLELRGVAFSGNTAISSEDLERVVESYIGRPLSYSSIQALRDAVTDRYVAAGFATSGAVIPDQSLDGGILEVQIVEGSVGKIRIARSGRLRTAYVRARLRLAAGAPLDVERLRDRLRLLQEDDRIAAIHARLIPSARQGISTLEVSVDEAKSWNLGIRVNDYSARSIGSVRGEVSGTHANVTGWGDSLFTEVRVSPGLWDLAGSYSVPLGPLDTRLGVFARATWTEVVEEPFDDLGIESRTRSYGVQLAQRIPLPPGWEASAIAQAEWRRSTTYLFEERTSFTPGPEDGNVTLAIVRLGGELQWRGRDRALAARLLTSFGTELLGATANSATDVPDGKFVSMLAQAQFARRFDELQRIEVVARASLQLADGPLFGIEQFAIGGHSSVRGYLENQLIRDQGATGGLEIRVPVELPRWGRRRTSLKLLAFADAGGAWNAGRPSPGTNTLASVGIGALVAIDDWLSADVYWGVPLVNDEASRANDPQANGLHLELRAAF